MSAGAALSAIGKVAGIQMEPGGNLRDEVFVVSVHDVTVNDLMKRIAQAESGKWLQQNGIYILSRESSTSISQERAELAALRVPVAREAEMVPGIEPAVIGVAECFIRIDGNHMQFLSML